MRNNFQETEEFMHTLKPTVKIISVFSLLAFSFVFLLSSCENEEEVFLPKPRAFLRIDLPEKKYRLYDSICPFSFQVPVYAKIESEKNACWLNLVFPAFSAKLHMSYHELHGDLPRYLEDAYELASKHQIRASGLEEQVVLRDSAKVFGLIYNIEGNTATSTQFYLTDSTHNFYRGSLYFNCPPNIDSLKLVIDFLKQDVFQLIQSFSWKEKTPTTR